MWLLRLVVLPAPVGFPEREARAHGQLNGMQTINPCHNGLPTSSSIRCLPALHSGLCCQKGGVLPAGGCCDPSLVCGASCCTQGQKCVGST